MAQIDCAEAIAATPACKLILRSIAFFFFTLFVVKAQRVKQLRLSGFRCVHMQQKWQQCSLCSTYEQSYFIIL
uniref:Putative secreted protein n=1 Tax=Rhipicephalus microplus TaxID=6941 RepID=A0A6M2DBH7_RHIMP